MRVIAFVASLLVTVGLLVAPPAAASTPKLAAVGSAKLWVSLLDSPSGDAGADIRVTLLVNGKAVLSGTRRCVTHLSASSTPVTVGWAKFSPRNLKAHDRVTFKVSVRSGTIAEGIPCGSAAGGELKLAYNSSAAKSRFVLRITPGAKVAAILRAGSKLSTGKKGPRPGATKTKVSGTLNEHWQTLGTWKLVR